MDVNKVDYCGKTIVDMTDATATPETVLEGYTAYGANGTRIVGTASGTTGATLTVIAPEGAVVTVSKGDNSQSKIAANGNVIFVGLETGTWTVSAVKDGDSASKTVEIKADYETQISFFAATIHVVYPAGLTCTATDGTTTLTAPDTGGKWDCVVAEAGEWTVKLSTGFAEKITIGATGEEATVDKWYVYKDGDQRTDLTGGWTAVKKQSPTVEFKEDRFYASAGSTTNQPAGMAISNNALNLTGFKTLSAAANMLKSLNSTTSVLELGVAKTKRTSAALNGGVVYKSVKGTGEHTLSVDISGVGEDLAALYPYFNIYCCQGELYKLWLEV